jgi:hypothetical protein
MMTMPTTTRNIALRTNWQTASAREANKEKMAGYLKNYRDANKDKIAENNRKYYSANKEKIQEQKQREKIKN